MRSLRLCGSCLLVLTIALGLALLRDVSATPKPALTAPTVASGSPSQEVLLQRHAAFHQRMADRTRPVAAELGDPTPVPIPGGLNIPGFGLIHVFLPGPPEIGFQGEDVEPSVITHYRGFTAIAYLAGTARGSDGVTYDMFNDIRVMSGIYVSVDGTRHRGTFVLT